MYYVKPWALCTAAEWNFFERIERYVPMNYTLMKIEPFIKIA